jgi:autotransporter-associated beta strand protein
VVILNSDNALGKNGRLSLQGASNVVQAGGADRVFSNGLDFGAGFSTTFSGSNSLTFNGGVNFDSGTTSGGFNNRLDPGKLLTISGTINMSNGAAANDFRIASFGATLISADIVGGPNSSVSFYQSDGVVTFSGSNSYTGPTNLGAGGAAPTLVLASDHALAGGGLLVFNRGIVQAGGADRVFANTIQITKGSGGTVIAAFSGGHSLTFTGGMIVSAPLNGKQSAISNDIVAGKRLTISGSISASDSGSDNIFTIGGSGETWITGDISNGGGTNTILKLIGTGITVLSGSNSYSGATTLGGQNTLRLVGSNALGTGSLIFAVGGRGVVELGAGNSLFTRALGTGPGQVAWEEAPGGFGAYGADATVNIGGAGAGYIWGSTTNFLRTYQRLLLSSATSDHKVTWVNGMDLNGLQRTVEVSNGSALVDADISGVISGRAGSSLQKVGAGTLELSGANTYIGATLIEEGVLKVSSVDISGGSSNIGNSGNVQLGTASTSGRLDYVGLSGTLNGALSVKEGGGRIDTVTAGQTLTIATASGTVGLAGTLTVGGAGNTVIKSGLATGTGGLVKTDSGTVTIAGNSNNYTGATTVSMGRLLVSGSLTQTASVSVASGATLTVDGFINTSANVVVDGVLNGQGRLGAISGSGLVGPGNSPGTLTATTMDSKDGLDYAFEFTSTGSPNYGNSSASVNDILRLTGETPFVTALGASNSVAIYLNVASLSIGDSFRGGFYTDNDASFLDQVENAEFTFYLANPEGAATFNAANYDLYSGPLTFKIDTVREMANFEGGTVYGYVSEFSVVPEPGSAVLWIAGLGLTVGWIRRSRRVNG